MIPSSMWSAAAPCWRPLEPLATHRSVPQQSGPLVKFAKFCRDGMLARPEALEQTLEVTQPNRGTLLEETVTENETQISFVTFTRKLQQDRTHGHPPMGVNSGTSY